MMIRDEVRAFVELGPFPSEDDGVQEDIELRETKLNAIVAPVTDEEAAFLLASFGPPDSCYGLAWALLHLIETAPNPAVTSQPEDAASEWRHRLWRRHQNGLGQWVDKSHSWLVRNGGIW